MFAFVYQDDVIATADNEVWLLYLYAQYPNGEIIYRGEQPVVSGAQTL